MMQQQQEITPQVFAQTMGTLKRRISQTAGETQQMTADVMSQTLDQVMQLSNQVFNQSAMKDKQIKDLSEYLEKCYNAHPELKVIVEEPEKPKKGTAKKV